jgi:lipoate-protein ligase A
MIERCKKFIKKLEDLTRSGKIVWSFRVSMMSEIFHVCNVKINDQKFSITRFAPDYLSLNIEEFSYHISTTEVQDDLKRLLKTIEEVTIDKTENAIDLAMAKL